MISTGNHMDFRCSVQGLCVIWKNKMSAWDPSPHWWFVQAGSVYCSALQHLQELYRIVFSLSNHLLIG